MIDLTFRSFSRARWIAVATSRGVYNANGDINDGFTVDEIGAPTLSNGVLDTWFWTNIRLTSGIAQSDIDALYPGDVDTGLNFTKSKLAAFVRNQATITSLTIDGQPVTVYEFGTLTNRIQLLDPRSYAALRRREWFGGMSF